MPPFMRRLGRPLVRASYLIFDVLPPGCLPASTPQASPTAAPRPINLAIEELRGLAHGVRDFDH